MVKALLTAKDVIWDAVGQMWHIHSIFDTLLCRAFPWTINFCIFGSAIDVQGEVSASFEVLDPDLNPVYRYDFPPQEGGGSKAANSYGCRIADLPVARAGRYSIQFLLNGKTVSSVWMDVAPVSVNQTLGG